MGGGEVIVVYPGTFTMSGGAIISGNTIAGSGGGILDDGMFTMKGGEISGNSAGKLGGGIYLVDWCTPPSIINKTGGTIYGYTNGDLRSNTVKNSSGGPVSQKGHAIAAASITGNNLTRYRDTTVTGSLYGSSSPSRMINLKDRI